MEGMKLMDDEHVIHENYDEEEIISESEQLAQMQANKHGKGKSG